MDDASPQDIVGPSAAAPTAESQVSASIQEAQATAPQAAPKTVLPLDYESPSGHRWTVGTLKYTLGGLILLFFWLLIGDFAISMRDRSVGPVAQLLLKKFQASDTAMAAFLSFIPQAISMVMGPIISYKSDRFRSRWGRRIPFLLIPTPIAAISMMGLAFTPWVAAHLHAALGASSPGLKACTLLTFGTLWTAFEFAVITANAVLGGLINDVVPRGVLGRFFGMFRAVSLIAGMLFNYWIIGKAETHYGAIFIGIGLLFGVGFTVMCFMVKEGDYPPPDQASEGDFRAGGFFAAVGIYFRECFSQPYYLWVFAAMTLAAVTFLPVNLFSVLYAKSLNMSMDDYGWWIAVTYLASLFLSYPLGWLVDKFHSLRVGMVALALYAVSALLGAMLIKGPTSFGWALWAHGVLSGTYLTASASLGQALLPKMKFGQYASAAALVTSTVTMILSLVIGQMLDLSGHNYRLTFTAGFFLDIATLITMYIVYRKFLGLGGTQSYVAPDSN